MSVSRLFSVIGDANVRRNMTGLNIASRDVMKAAQVIDCTMLSDFDRALSEVKPESNALIVASVTEFLIASGDCGTIFSSIDPPLASFAAKLINFCAFKPDIQACSAVKTFQALILSDELLSVLFF